MQLLALLLSGTIYFVDGDAVGANDGTSWQDAFVDLQSALAVAGFGQEIWVAEGIYRPSPTLDRAASFLVPHQVKLYGGFAGTETDLSQRAGLFDTTVLSGDLAGDDGPGFTGRDENSLHVVSVIQTLATLDGFTIRSGNANAFSYDELDRTGGGMLLYSSGSTLRNCTFLENESVGGGGAVYGFFLGYATYLDCTFQDNRTLGAGGAIGMLITSGMEARRCRFLGNASAGNGGAIDADYAETFCRDCDFEGNRAEGAGGALCADGQQFFYAAVQNCRFHDNVARGEGGGAIANRASFLGVINSVFTGNSADGCASGGGALLAGPYGTLVANCSIFGNSAENAGTGTGGTLAAANGPLQIVNSISWGNFDDSGTSQSAQIASLGGSLQCSHSCIQGWDGTLGSSWVVNADPRFVDPDGADDQIGTRDDDLRLRPLSPCIDSADETSYFKLNWGEADLDGNVRFVDALVCDGAADVLDIGALERPTIDGTTNHCPARDSSLGVPAILDAPCAPSFAANDFSVSAAPVPSGVGVLVFGQGFERAPWGNGVLCVGGPLLATAPERTLGATLSFALDFDQPPGDVITAGSSWSFQVVYRDPLAGGAGFNLSDAVRCTFRP